MPSKGSTTARGYGSAHQRTRAKWVRKVRAGGVNCWRCGAPINPCDPWDLGHDDADRSRYRGPEHIACNRATKGRNKKQPTHTGKLIVVTGPPASGKSTWVKRHAKPGDITIDYDAIANVLTPPDGKPHKHAAHIRAITKAARQAAIDKALVTSGDHAVYIIHSLPAQSTLSRYRSLGAQVVTIDPGRKVVMARCKAERPWQMQQAAKEWYERQLTNPATQQTSDSTGPLSWFDGDAGT